MRAHNSPRQRARPVRKSPSLQAISRGLRRELTRSGVLESFYTIHSPSVRRVSPWLAATGASGAESMYGSGLGLDEKPDEATLAIITHSSVSDCYEARVNTVSVRNWAQVGECGPKSSVAETALPVDSVRSVL